MAKNPRMYIGPDRPFGQPFRHGCIFSDEPEHVYPALRQLFAEHESLAKLFVPVAGVAIARAALARPETAYSAFYKEIKTASDNFKLMRK